MEPLNTPIPDSNNVPAESWKQPQITQSGLKLDINADIFEGGRARLQCVGTIFNLYPKVAELVLEEDKSKLTPLSQLRTKDATGNGIMAHLPSAALLTIAGFWLLLR